MSGRAGSGSTARRWPEPPSATTLGTALLALLGVSGLTGIVLALSYDASPERAHRVVADQVGGALGFLWGVHAWTASLLLLLAVLHPARAWLRGRVREVSWRKWLTGTGALGVLVFAFFSGTVLPWDQQGWEAFQHVQHGVDVLGVSLFDVEAPSEAPLNWAFLAHVFAVPALLAGAVGWHLWRGVAWRTHLTTLAKLLRGGLRRAWPLAALAVGLALLWPPLHGPAPVPRLQVTRPDWPFLWLLPVQRSLDSLGLWALPAGVAAVGALRLLPEGSRAWRLGVLGLVAAAWFGLTLVGLGG